MNILVVARSVGHLVMFTVLGFAATLALTMSVPVLFGYQSLTMLSGSMGHAIPTGSVIIDETIKPLEARPGDVLTFADPERSERLLTHRLRSLQVKDELVHVATRGDANDTDEHWSIPLDGTVGRVAYSIPFVGYARAWVNQHTGRTALFVVLAVVAGYTLLEVWLPVPLTQVVRRSRGGSRRRSNTTGGAAVPGNGALALSGET